jgi:hypothetical protein
VKQEDEQETRRLHIDFCTRWSITAPIHSVEIRGKTKEFLWLRGLQKEEQDTFFEELYQLMRTAPVVGLACVIDRPGYNDRYREKYGDQRWMLCKTAFNIAVERAAKFARGIGYRLRVAPERCNKAEDGLLSRYYYDLKTVGMPFATSTSDKYGPLSAEQFGETLYEFKPKHKTSPMAQVADLYLWPLCMGGYHMTNRPYQRLLGDGKLIECSLPFPDWPKLGTKYSCFEGVERKS